MKRSDFGGQRSFAFTTFRLVLFQIGTRLSHRGWGGQAAVPVSPQGQPADIGEARNRPGLLAHGGGWAHLCLRRVCLPVCLPDVACVMSFGVVVSPVGAAVTWVLEAPRRAER